MTSFWAFPLPVSEEFDWLTGHLILFFMSAPRCPLGAGFRSVVGGIPGELGG